MKKTIAKIILVIVIMIVISCIAFGCVFSKFMDAIFPDPCAGLDYSGWKKVSTGKNFDVMIPSDWVDQRIDGLCYVLHNDGDPVMIETSSFPYERGNMSTFNLQSNKFFKNFEIELPVTISKVITERVRYGRVDVKIDGQEKELFFISWDENYFILWDESVSEETVHKLAASFYN